MRYKLLGLLICALSFPTAAVAEYRTWQEGDQTWIQEGHCIVVQRECSEESNLRMVPELAPHRLLFLNRCVGGETFSSASEDESRLNRSSIIRNGERAMSEFPYSDAAWDKVVAAVRRFYAPFDIRVTDVDPGDAAHAEVAVCGSGEEWGIVNSGNTVVLGISPKLCNVIPNSISFAFPVDHGNNPELIAETVAHEAGHAFSLDHEEKCEDLMSYDCREGKDGFVDEDSACVEYNEDLSYEIRDCYCDPPEFQNSHQSLRSAFGEGTPLLPKVIITAPLYNAVVEPGFAVQITIEDPYNATSQAELWVDGVNTFTLTSPPFAFNGPTELADGSHEVEVRVMGWYGDSSDSVMVVVGPPCQGSDDCQDSEACVEGRCVVGPGESGGLGEECASADDCASGLCASDGLVKRCTEICTPAKQLCPGGFACVGAGDDGVCWPSEDDDDSGGCAVARDPAVPWLPLALALLGLFGWLARRRRD